MPTNIYRHKRSVASNRKCQGFTLIEVLVALTIFSVGLLAIAGMQTSSIMTTSAANIRTVQTDIGTSILNEILIWPDSSFIDTNNLAVPWPANPISVTAGGTYTATYTIATNYNGVGNLGRVQVVVQQGNDVQRALTVTGFRRGE